ncbi:hypothetical protein AJ78_08687 [Emergomyces pasteurianus Ep9510]|uniref:R3H-associated N-terminal domain-containing protein n=1 Tax=Emergomyces pasteurianus Ep9510 TaxID=1447872 RepID=A0A1J9P074_9EURO|nr:hypothetical protein AJ78_08687 [Emergomyces pasteurianus Ep9510]
MAIHPALHAEGSLTPHQAQEISAWTQQASQSIHGDDGATPTTRVPGTSVSLTIPLDDEHPSPSSLPLRVRMATHGEGSAPVVSSATYSRREPLRRDSLKRRDALLKGKEGSRRRQRWENDRLLNNPWVQPPSAIDWQVQPTYERRTVPYYLAPLWDSHYAAREQAKSNNGSRKSDAGADAQSQIPRELRLRLKHARAARGLLRDLEEEIRRFVERYHEKQAVSSRDEEKAALDGVQSILFDEDKWEKLQDKAETETETEKEFDSDDDEIVFVGRRAQRQDTPVGHTKDQDRSRKPNRSNNDGLDEKDSEKMVFESLEEDRAAGFGRWLVHSLASYYGLRTWSITVGNPARREAYVGINPPTLSQQQHRRDYRSASTIPGNNNTSVATAGRYGATASRAKSDGILPQPLWVSVCSC